MTIAEGINQDISFRGPWFFQIKKSLSGKFKLLEIATRFAGAFSLSRCMDINLPLMALRDFDGQDIDFYYNDLLIEADKMFIGRYTITYEYDTVYFDDIEVIIRDGIIDTFFMMFVYQCINKGKKLVLLTENNEKAHQILYTLKLSDRLFYDMIDNFDYGELDYARAVFISRSEAIRNILRREYGVVCFDPTTIEALIDWRA